VVCLQPVSRQVSPYRECAYGDGKGVDLEAGVDTMREFGERATRGTATDNVAAIAEHTHELLGDVPIELLALAHSSLTSFSPSPSSARVSRVAGAVLGRVHDIDCYLVVPAVLAPESEACLVLLAGPDDHRPAIANVEMVAIRVVALDEGLDRESLITRWIGWRSA
jgi:hypothetical protein